MKGERRWEVWADTGGTFTDCVAVSPEGELRRSKVLSSGALRARVLGAPEPGRWRIAVSGGLLPGPLGGWRLRSLGGEGDRVSPCRLESGGVLVLEEDEGEGALPDLVELVSPEEAPVLAARLATGTPPGGDLPPMRLRVATTLGTNALLERRGAPTVLVVTRGFRDLLEIGTQQRPELFALEIVKPEPLPAAVVEVHERVAADGEVLRPPDVEGFRRDLEEAMRPGGEVEGGLEAGAVSLLHSYRDPSHEEAVEEVLLEAGVGHVSRSSSVAPRQGYLARTETTVVDATLSPILGRYLERVRRDAGTAEILVMTSAGGLVDAGGFRPKDGLLSGPAGGVVGAAAAARRSGFEDVLSFDMGGTSTDVARVDSGRPAYTFEHEVGEVRLLAPAVEVETVAAGGGSVCDVRLGRLVVGPESGGASPGPACYGAGGPFCLTDVNLLLGRLVPERFHIPLERDAASAALAAIRRRVAAQEGERVGDEELLAGFLRIADERMADAIRRISVRKGVDPRRYALVAFGGAGPQHAASVAELLGVETVIVPPDAGLLSARGLGAATVERFAEDEVLERLEAVEDVGARLESLAGEAEARVRAEGGGEGPVEVRRRIAELRLLGQESTVDVEAGDGRGLRERFVVAYRERFGHDPGERPVELVALRVVAGSVAREDGSGAIPGDSDSAGSAVEGELRSYLGGDWCTATVRDRDGLEAGALVPGPGIVAEAHSTTVVPPGWAVRVDEVGSLVLERGVPGGSG